MLNKNKNLRLLKIGYIVKPHGTKGELCILLYKNFILKKNDKVFFENSTNLYGPYKISSIRKHKNFWLIGTKNLKTIEEVQNFTGASIGIKVKKLPPNFFWIEDIINCSVYLKDGNKLGKIIEVLKTGANDIYVVQSVKGTEILIPAIKQIVKNIDIKNKNIIIEPIDGLIE